MEDDLCVCYGHDGVSYNFGVEIDTICDRCGGYFFSENMYALKTKNGRKRARVITKEREYEYMP